MKKEIFLPGEIHLHSVPRWARVAFAARAVRRVQSLFGELHLSATSRQKQTIDHALELAENAAKEGFESDHPLVKRIAEAQEANKKLAETLLRSSAKAAWIALGAAYAAEAAQTACVRDRNLVAEIAAKAVNAAVEAAGEGIIEKLHRDFQKLAKAAEAEEWTKNTLVAPKFFGAVS